MPIETSSRLPNCARRIRLGWIVFLLSLFAVQSADAQANLTWDVNGATAGTGGTGTWDTTSLIWFNGSTFQAWNNATFDNGVFGGTVGTVTVGTPINVHNLTFNVTGYSVNGGTLTLGGTTPTITTDHRRHRDDRLGPCGCGGPDQGRDRNVEPDREPTPTTERPRSARASCRWAMAGRQGHWERERSSTTRR